MPRPADPSRRQFLKAGIATAAGTLLPSLTGTPALIATERERPRALQGLHFADPHRGSVAVWSRSDRPARMLVEWSADEHFANASRVLGPHALEVTDYTARQVIDGLEPGRDIFVRVSFESLTSARVRSEPITGRFTVPPDAIDAGRGVKAASNIRFVWGGDTAGQGFGINPAFGGMTIYEAMRQRRPLFFIHSGDNIYADEPIPSSTMAEGGRVWTNLVTPEVTTVAETMEQFRGRYRYNLLDDNLRRFNAEVAQIWQWDDHEVSNNWSDSLDLRFDRRYSQKEVPLLAARGARAFMEYAAMRPSFASESGRVYRSFSYGPLLELFVLDMRSYRGPNSANLQEMADEGTAFLGREQLEWLKAGLAHSRAVWKVIAADMSIGVQEPDGASPDGRMKWDAVGNGDPGAPRGRELEFADLLSSLKQRGVKNVVWLTADVHYCAAHHYDPCAATVHDFEPFWEFVAGPLNAGTFEPCAMDATFGPRVVFARGAPAGQSGLSPYSGQQFFGEVNIDAQSGNLTVDLRDLRGTSVFTTTLQARTTQ